VSKHESLDPPCPSSKKVTEAWDRLQKASPDKRAEMVRIMNSIVSSHQFVKSITNFTGNGVLNAANPDVVQQVKVTRSNAEAVKKGGSVELAQENCRNGRCSVETVAQSTNEKPAMIAQALVHGSAVDRAPASLGVGSASCLAEQLSTVMSIGPKIDGGPKQSYTNSGFSQSFAESIQIENQDPCLKDKSFENQLRAAEKDSRPEGCACRHPEAIRLMKEEQEQCPPNKNLGECERILGEYSYLVGSVLNLGLKPLPLKDLGNVEESPAEH
jgi:hypothetical protein